MSVLWRCLGRSPREVADEAAAARIDGAEADCASRLNPAREPGSAEQRQSYHSGKKFLHVMVPI